MKKQNFKMIAILLILALSMPFALYACGGDSGGATTTTTTTTAEEAATTTTTTETTTTTTTETTTTTTETPTEPPTDPAELATPVQIGDFEIIPGARYYLWSPNSNLYLTSDKESKWTGFSQDEFTGAPNQMFVFEYVREYDNAAGTATFLVFNIRALGTKASYVDFEEGDGKTDGKMLVASTLDAPQAEGSQEFTLKAQKKPAGFEDIDLPIFSVMSVLSNNARCIDINGVSVDPGAYAHMWSGGASANQKWFFELVADVEAGKIIPRGNQEIAAAE